eukprot:3907962-Rhodomonas_salina.1
MGATRERRGAPAACSLVSSARLALPPSLSLSLSAFHSLLSLLPVRDVVPCASQAEAVWEKRCGGRQRGGQCAADGVCALHHTLSGCLVVRVGCGEGGQGLSNGCMAGGGEWLILLVGAAAGDVTVQSGRGCRAGGILLAESLLKESFEKYVEAYRADYSLACQLLQHHD